MHWKILIWLDHTKKYASKIRVYQINVGVPHAGPIKGSGESFEAYGGIYSYDDNPAKITHRIESNGDRTVGFEKETFSHYESLFIQVFEWYTNDVVQPLTDKFGEKYSQIHAKEFRPHIEYKDELKS